MSIQPHSNGHDTHHTPGIAEATCPYCGQSISRKEYRDIQARIETEERARLAKIEAELKARVAREVAKAEAGKKAEVAKIKKDAEQQFKAAKATLEATVNARLLAQREASDKKLTETIAVERTKAYEDRMKLDAQLQDLQRQLQRRTANELGDEGEIDLFDALMTAFPQDQIARTPKGVEGGDVVQRVFFNGAVIGSLIYEAKNHRRWMSKWPGKLRQDQLAAGASFAVLVTTVFPSAAQQLAVVDEVIVSSPARAIAVAHILRRMVIETHRLRLSNEARESKTERLFAFLVSNRAADFWKQIETATNDMIDLDRVETTAHQKVWAKRAELVRTIIVARDDLAGTVDGIVRGDPDDLP